MSLPQRTLQFFFLFLGIIFVIMFLIRWLAPDSRAVLWSVLCPAGTKIEILSGEAELEPGEIVAAYEVVCTGEGIRQPLSDIQLLLIETGTPLGLAVVLAVIFGAILSIKRRDFRSLTNGVPE